MDVIGDWFVSTWGSLGGFLSALLEGAVTDLVLVLATGALGFLLAWWGRSRKMVRVDLKVRKVTAAAASRIRPRFLVATFSGYTHKPDRLSAEEFATALEAADLDRLPLEESTPGIGTTVKLLRTYPEVERLYLLTTRTEGGLSSIESVPLLRAWARREGIGAVIVAEEEHCIDLEADDQVTREAFDAVESAFAAIRRTKGGRKAKVLVDLTGGPRSMLLGAAFACLRPDQDVHLIGSRYDRTGSPVKGESFPLLVDFRPKLPGR